MVFITHESPMNLPWDLDVYIYITQTNQKWTNLHMSVRFFNYSTPFHNQKQNQEMNPAYNPNSKVLRFIPHQFGTDRWASLQNCSSLFYLFELKIGPSTIRWTGDENLASMACAIHHLSSHRHWKSPEKSDVCWWTRAIFDGSISHLHWLNQICWVVRWFSLAESLWLLDKLVESAYIPSIIAAKSPCLIVWSIYHPPQLPYHSIDSIDPVDLAQIPLISQWNKPTYGTHIPIETTIKIIGVLGHSLWKTKQCLNS